MKESSRLQQLARLVMKHHVGSAQASADIADAARRVFEELLSSLSPLIGEVGSQALFRRSVKLTEPAFAGLRGLKQGSALEALVAGLRAQKSEAAMEASVALLATYLHLLATFIGERLTWRLLEEAWPDLIASFSWGADE
jgi:hypothetical protein